MGGCGRPLPSRNVVAAPLSPSGEFAALGLGPTKVGPVRSPDDCSAKASLGRETARY